MNGGRHAGLARDPEDFVQALVNLVGLGALVRDVAAAEASGHLGERDQFVGAREAVRHVLERSGDAEGARLHGFGNLRLHLLQFGRRGRAILAADNAVPHAAGADERPEVDGGRLSLEYAEVAGQVVEPGHLSPCRTSRQTGAGAVRSGGRRW